ncbi:MAG: 6,7-dimethyl-8-ribityllumazine synthase [Actinomycetes bacterium]
MSGAGAPRFDNDATGIHVVVVASSWHDVVMGGLVDGAVRALEAMGADYVVVRVPGAFELPLVAKAAAATADAVVALGVVIRGGTPHFDYVCQAATDGLTRVAIDTGVPIGFGLLTCDTEEQAIARAGLPGSIEDKGREAVEAAISALLTLRSMKPRGSVGFAT